MRIVFYTTDQWNRLWESAKGATVFRSEYEKLGSERIKDQFLNKKSILIKCSAEELPAKIMEWSKSDAPKHFFVKEIEIGYQSDTIPHDVYLVDTPGLSDPVKYRSDITRKYIKNSDWILACISAENLSGQPEFNFLSKVISNKNGNVDKIFVVATKKDMLTNDEGQKKAHEFRTRLSELYDNESLANSRFSFVAAECHLLTSKVIKGIALEKEEKKKLKKTLVEIDDDLEFDEIVDKADLIYKYAGINALFNHIDNVVLRNRRKLIIKAIEEDYSNTMKLIKDNASAFIDDKKEYMHIIVGQHESGITEIEEIEEGITELQILEDKLKVIKEKLKIKIDRNGGE